MKKDNLSPARWNWFPRGERTRSDKCHVSFFRASACLQNFRFLKKVSLSNFHATCLIRALSAETYKLRAARVLLARLLVRSFIRSNGGNVHLNSIELNVAKQLNFPRGAFIKLPVFFPRWKSLRLVSSAYLARLILFLCKFHVGSKTNKVAAAVYLAKWLERVIRRAGNYLSKFLLSLSVSVVQKLFANSVLWI